VPTNKAPGFEFEIHLIDGQKVTAEIGADDFEKLRDNNPGYVVPEGLEPRLAAASLMHSMLLHRVVDREGATGVRDRDGRNWIIPGTSIVGWSYRDLSKEERQLVGFDLPR
jgi:hypothetical protein